MSRFWISCAAAATLMLGGAALAQSDAYKSAIADPARPTADTSRDAERKPAEMLAFANVKPGMTIAELSPGGGYFTRIFARAIGPTGHIYTYSAPAPQRPAGPPPGGGMANGGMAGGGMGGGAMGGGMMAGGARPAAPAAAPPPVNSTTYPNLTALTGQYADFAVPAKVDMVWTSRNYHDFHNIPGIDMVAFDKKVFDALKPGGIFIVLDHAADEKATNNVTGELHRIKESTVKSEVEAAGFKLIGSSDAVRHPADDKTKRVFDNVVKDTTDQFLLKFQKPN